jgi:hypothetical protein
MQLNRLINAHMDDDISLPEDERMQILELQLKPGNIIRTYGDALYMIIKILPANDDRDKCFVVNNLQCRNDWDLFPVYFRATFSDHAHYRIDSVFAPCYDDAIIGQRNGFSMSWIINQIDMLNRWAVWTRDKG